MRMIVYEGTPEEIAAFRAALDRQGEDKPPASAPAPHPSVQGFVSTDIARKVLTRRPLSAEQRLVLHTLYDAGEQWTAAPILQSYLNYSKSQFAGLMGAFGRRLSQTSGHKPNTWLFEQEWNYEEGYNLYRLPASVRSALADMEGFGR